MVPPSMGAKFQSFTEGKGRSKWEEGRGGEGSVRKRDFTGLREFLATAVGPRMSLSLFLPLFHSLGD
jgi:hypothetical protein